MFSTYSSWCTNIVGEKKRAIAKGNEEMEMAQAEIQQFSAEAGRLGEEIAELDETIATIEGDTKAATKVRDMEHTDFLNAQNDYQGSVDALAGGIDTLKAKAHDVEGAQFTQEAVKVLRSPVIPSKAQKYIWDFIDQDPEQKLANSLKIGSRREMSMLQTS